MPISVPGQHTLMKTLLKILFKKKKKTFDSDTNSFYFKKKKAQEEMKFTKSTGTKFLVLKAKKELLKNVRNFTKT